MTSFTLGSGLQVFSICFFRPLEPKTNLWLPSFFTNIDRAAQYKLVVCILYIFNFSSLLFFIKANTAMISAERLCVFGVFILFNFVTFS